MGENLVLLFFLGLPFFLFMLLRWFFVITLPQWLLSGRRIQSLVCGNGIVLMLLLSVVVLSGEIYFRYFYDSTDSFGLCKTTTRWFERYYHKNKFGFRDSIEYSLMTRADKRRITFIGDSFTAGHGVPDVEDRFGNRIRNEQSVGEVHVIAECGWDTGHQLGYAETLSRTDYETDVVVLVYCLNDISDIVPEWQEILDRVYDQPQPGFFATHSFLFNTLNARLRMSEEPEVADYYSFVRKAYEGPVWEQQAARLTRLRDMAVNQGRDFYVVTFPFLHDVGVDYSYGHIHRKLDEFWSEVGVPHLDLLEVVSGKRPEELVVSRRDAHPNEATHAMAAKAISAFIESEQSRRIHK